MTTKKPSPEISDPTDQIEQEGWHYTIVENAVLDDLTLNIYTRLLYVYLCKFSDKSKQCFPSIQRLATTTGMSPNRVRASLDELQQKGYLIKTMRRNGELNLTNVYKLRYIQPKLTLVAETPESDTPEVLHEVQVGTAPDEVGVLHEVQGGTAPRAPKLKPFNYNQLELKYSLNFDQFWETYPRKVDKQAALRKFIAQITKGYLPADLIGAAKHYAAYCKANETDMQYIKHAATFLGRDKPFAEFINGLPEAPPGRKGAEPHETGKTRGHTPGSTNDLEGLIVRADSK